MRTQEPEPGKWQVEVDNYGGVRRYRIIGGVKEYEPQITTTYGTVAESDIKDANRRKITVPHIINRLRTCPFATTAASQCKGDLCALYDGGCIFSKAAATRQTAGRRCPFNNQNCKESCALYNDGCSFTATIKESEA